MAVKKPVTSLQVVEYLRQRIESGEWKPDDKLPSERTISETIHTSRVTTREALKQLEAEGKIYRSNRRGWFVTPERIRYNPARVSYFMEYVAEQGFEPFSRQLSKTLCAAGGRLAARMSVDADEELLQIERLRGVDGRPVYFEQIYLRPSQLPGLAEKDLEHSVSAVLRQQYGREYDQVELDISVASLSAEQAELLQAPAGYTCLVIQRLTRDQYGTVIEYDREFWRHDALQMNLLLGAGAA
ncbi:UTRA domain-containing protein [Marinobacterium jannaschii]|uniref:UTRA domain-containing protein n=1 Tax=Marinobacterium jannaschii TaxID=64970 RepID=UPI0004893170|nr:UTRA domain-containing protein [Marinobacterium jannaschii]